jgi:ABC-type metal ion transport system substrate-binding protein
VKGFGDVVVVRFVVQTGLKEQKGKVHEETTNVHTYSDQISQRATNKDACDVSCVGILSHRGEKKEVQMHFHFFFFFLLARGPG